MDRPIFVSADVFHLLHSPIYSFFSIEFHRVHAFDTFFVGGNAPAYHLIKPFQSSRLSMKNKPAEKERKKKKDKEGEKKGNSAYGGTETPMQLP